MGTPQHKIEPEYVKFQRIVMGWLAAAALFLHNVDLVWLFLLLTLPGLLLGTNVSPTTLLYRLVRRLFRFGLVRISEHHIRYYQINRAIDFIDHLLRSIVAAIALVLYHNGLEMAAWVVMGFLSVFMMVSAYFGFCLSGLSYIALKSLHDRLRRVRCETTPGCTDTDTGTRKFNSHCTLARHGFTPYKRCDSCYIDIGRCLGTKFNVSMIVVGIVMALFLFDQGPIITPLVIIVIMTVLFWLGYQVNYATDDLAESIDKNRDLNVQLTEYNLSLEQKVQERTAEIERLATYDMLTGIFNRFVFEQRLNERFKSLAGNAGRYHFAFIDMDKFKQVNDTAGHLAGDKLLCHFADLLSEVVGDHGVVGRLGGDEFAILFEQVSIEEALQICNTICDRVKALDFTWEGKHFAVGASIGLATLERSMQDMKAVMHHADVACYRAKKEGGQVALHAG